MIIRHIQELLALGVEKTVKKGIRMEQYKIDKIKGLKYEGGCRS